MTTNSSAQQLTTGWCGRRGQRTMFFDISVAGAAQPGRYAQQGRKVSEDMNNWSMTARSFVLTTILSVVFAVSGCSTAVSKFEPGSELGNPYSGVKYSVGVWDCALFFLAGGAPLTLLAAPVVVPVLAVDTALSLVADTAMAPVDMMNESKNKTPRYGCKQ